VADQQAVSSILCDLTVHSEIRVQREDILDALSTSNNRLDNVRIDPSRRNIRAPQKEGEAA
jgi:hypothetical protein